ncbi:MAG: ORF6N domain-containing protein [Desulfatiglans sp.]|nr:ORF6N domain-containing protein [Desulfatiglans sp.]
MEYSISVESIASKIIFIRGEKVLLDRDLAAMYGVTTKVLNQAVRRNSKRFPADFMFELTKEENLSLRSQNVTLKRGQHSKYLPFAFTEHGVAMLSSVLSSERAIEVNIAVVRAFVHLRKMAITYEALERKLRDIEDRQEGQEEKIEVIFEAIRQLMAPPEKKGNKIGFEVNEGGIKYS